MTPVQLAMLALAVTGISAGVGSRLRLPTPTLVFAAGVLAGLWPGLPPVALDPAIVLDLFLPALTYASAAGASWALLRWNALAGVAGGLAFTAVAIAACAGAGLLAIPGLGVAAAILLGVIAASAENGLAETDPEPPRALVETLDVQGLIGAVLIVTVFMGVRDSVEQGAPLADVVVRRVALDVLVGAPLGAGVAWLLLRLRSGLSSPAAELGVSIATPFLVALLMSLLRSSPVPAILAAGLVVAARHVDGEGRPLGSSEARLSAGLFWRAAASLLGNALFFVAGLTLPGVLERSEDAWRSSAALALLLALVVLPALTALATLAASGAGGLRRLYAARPRRSRARDALAAGWAATRSPIALVVAFAVPERLAERDVLLAFAGLLVAASLFAQATTAPRLLARLRVGAPDLAEAEAADARAALSGRSDDRDRRSALIRLREANRIGDETLERFMLAVEERVAAGRTGG